MSQEDCTIVGRMKGRIVDLLERNCLAEYSEPTFLAVELATDFEIFPLHNIPE